MPRTLEYFRVVAPESADDSGPVLAEAPSVFLDHYQDADKLVELPTEVDGLRLHRGMVVRGMAHIFVESAAEVRPHDLTVVVQDADVSIARNGAWD